MSEQTVDITVDRQALEGLRQGWQAGQPDSVIVSLVRALFEGRDGDLHLIAASLDGLDTLVTPAHLIFGHGYERGYATDLFPATRQAEHARLHADPTAAHLDHTHEERPC